MGKKLCLFGKSCHSAKENMLEEKTLQKDEDETDTIDFDHLLAKINAFGRYQKLQWLLLFLNVIPQAWYSYAPAFSAMAVPKKLISCTQSNWTQSVCETYNGTSCSRVYMASYTSIVSEFDLGCKDPILISMTKSIYYVGMLIGAYLFGWISDRYGRMTTLLSSAALQFICSLIQSFSVNYYMFTALRFPMGIGTGGNFNAAFVLATEMVGPNWRNLANGVVQSAYGFAMALQALIAFLLPNWKYFNLAITLPNILLISYLWLTPESPRWAFARGKRSVSKKILIKFAEGNSREFPDDLWEKTKESTTENDKEEDTISYTFFDLWKSRYLIKITLIESYSWFVASMVYFGLSFSAGSLSGNAYVNFAATGLVEIPAYAMAAYLVNRIGRRIPGSLYFIIGGVALLITLAIETTTGEDKGSLGIAIVIFALLGKFMISAAFSQVFIHSAELYPTVIRTVGLGTASMAARIGGILAPIITDKTPIVASYLVFGASAVVAGGLTLLLPETRGLPLLESIHDEHCKKSLPHNANNGALITDANGLTSEHDEKV